MLGLEKRKLSTSGPEVTFFGFGALEIGRNWGLGKGEEVARPAAEAAGQVLNAVLDMGINLIDTASAYHASEARIGEFIGQRRNKYILASKCGEYSHEPHTGYDFSFEGIAKSIDNSLDLLKTDCLDLLQIHFGPDSQKVLDDGETVAAMKEARAAGKVKLLGASIGGDVARQCIESGDFDVMQLGYSLLNQGEAELVEMCAQRGIGVLIRGGLGAGRLTPRVMPHLDELDEEALGKITAWLDLVGGDPELLTVLALKFLYRNPGVTSVLVGSKQAGHLRRNLELLETEMDEELVERALQIG
jgi:aryl-alcohol dehydrogenase-like predicted oxidoreductase